MDEDIKTSFATGNFIDFRWSSDALDVWNIDYHVYNIL